MTPRIVAGSLTFGKFALSGWFFGSCNRAVSVLMFAHSMWRYYGRGERASYRLANADICEGSIASCDQTPLHGPANVLERLKMDLQEMVLQWIQIEAAFEAASDEEV